MHKVADQFLKQVFAHQELHELQLQRPEDVHEAAVNACLKWSRRQFWKATNFFFFAVSG